MFPRAVPTSWVVRTVATDGTSIANLKPFEFGIFNKDTHVSLADGSVSSQRKVYFAVGSPNEAVFNQGSKVERLNGINNADVSFTTEVFPVRNLDLMRYQTPVRVEQPNVYYLGHNGSNGVCNSLQFECGQTYNFHVTLKGRPVRNIFKNEIREILEFDTDCCNNCTQTGCDTDEDCHLYIDDLIKRFNDTLWVSRFYTASKVVECATPPTALTRTNYNVYELTVCDNGDELALSKVVNQYTSYKVERVDRSGAYSTYRVIKTGAAPSAFSQQAVVFTNDCGDCPTGYTAVPAGDAYNISVASEVWTDNYGANDAATMETLLGVSAGDIATDGSITTVTSGPTMVFYVVVGNGSAIDVDAVATYGIASVALGTVPQTCTASEVTTSWVQVGTKYKVQRDLCLHLGANDDCEGNSGEKQNALLAEAQAFYAGFEEVVSGTVAFGADNEASGCVVQLTLSQYNNEYLEDGCDDEAGPVFDNLVGFKGQYWQVCPCEGWTVNQTTGCPVPPTASDNCCQCGIKFVGKPTTEMLDTFAGYDYATYLEKDPVEMSVTMYRFDGETDICDFTEPTWLHAQFATFRQLRGDDVVKRIITDRFYNQEPWVNQTNKTNQLFLRREGIKLGVTDLTAFYYAIDVYFNEDHNLNNTAAFNNTRHRVTLFVNEEDTATLASLRQKLAMSFPDAERQNWV